MNSRSDHPGLGGAPISRRGLIVPPAPRASPRPPARTALSPPDAEATLKVGFVSPRTGALGGFGETDGYVLELARKALATGLKVGDKTYGGRDPRSGHASPIPRAPASSPRP